MAPFSKFSGTVVGIFFALALTGCGVQFEAETSIRRDGSVERASRCIAQSQSDVDAIARRNILPEGETWVRKKWPVFDETKQQLAEKLVSVYEVKSHILPSQPLPADYIRLGNSPGVSSRNTITVSKQPTGWFAEQYEYRETFQDLGSAERVSEFFEKAFFDALTTYCLSIQERWGEPIELSELRRRLIEKYLPLLDQIKARVKTGGVKSLMESESQESVGLQLDNEEILAFLKSLGPAFVPGQEDRWNAVVTEAFHDVQETLSRRWEEMPASEREKVFGLHADLFRPFHFRLKALLPGRIIETNATSRSSRELIWDFDATDFFGQPYTAFAKSKAVAYGRLGFVSIAGVLLGLFLLRLLRAGSGTADRSK